jgi:hypothetical protein
MAATRSGEGPGSDEEHAMERMTMRTAGQLASVAGARLRVLLAGTWPIPAAAPCPAYACAPSASRLAIQGVSVNGTVKPGTTGVSRFTGHLARRHPERSP